MIAWAPVRFDLDALETGYLQEILVKEDQAVKKRDLMLRLLPVLFKAKLDAELAEAHLAELEYQNTVEYVARPEQDKKDQKFHME